MPPLVILAATASRPSSPGAGGSAGRWQREPAVSASVGVPELSARAIRGGQRPIGRSDGESPLQRAIRRVCLRVARSNGLPAALSIARVGQARKTPVRRFLCCRTGAARSLHWSRTRQGEAASRYQRAGITSTPHPRAARAESRPGSRPRRAHRCLVRRASHAPRRVLAPALPLVLGERSLGRHARGRGGASWSITSAPTHQQDSREGLRELPTLRDPRPACYEDQPDRANDLAVPARARNRPRAEARHECCRAFASSISDPEARLPLSTGSTTPLWGRNNAGGDCR